MTDIQKKLRHIALSKRDEKGEEGICVSEKSFVEWQAADEIKRLQKRNALLEDVAVAADLLNLSRPTLQYYNSFIDILDIELDKLREAGDE